jgi:diacylglycerol kinase family enzyme
MLIVVNPYATTVSDRLKNLVVYALQGRYDVEAVLTEAQHHAIEIGREACAGDYDIVVAFGGDGTLNEVANGLAGTDVPVSVLPGGSTNVVARTLGIPNDVVDATEHLLGLADDFRPRRIDLGVANGRRFVFACGAGLDATAARTVDSHPRMKARGGRWYYTYAAVSGFYGRYLRNPVRMRMQVDGETAEGITAIAQNSDPFTYFGNQPVRICENAEFDNGTLSVAMLRRAAQRDVPTIAARVLINRLRTPLHRQIEHFDGVTECRVESASKDAEGRIRPFPVQVDGDYIGDHGELTVGIEPAALSIIA